MCALCLAATVTGAAAAPPPPVEPRIVVDTAAQRLTVLRGDQVLLAIDNIAIGSNGTTRDKVRGDEKTPLGRFRIVAVKPSERFHIFMAFDYPTMAVADRAWRTGHIDEAEYRTIRRAWAQGETPPQDTSLGGALGIHGLGRGDLEVHRRFNWTNGCIALTNEEVDRLAGMVGVGTRVEVR